MPWDEFFRLVFQVLIMGVLLFTLAAAGHTVYEKFRETRRH